MHPVLHDLLAGGAVALRSLVLMMREPEVDAAGVDIDDIPEQSQAHRTALGVPAGEAGAPRRLPHQLGASGAGALPQRPVGVEPLRALDRRIELVTGLELVESVAGEASVLGVAARVEEHRTIGADIRVLALEKRADELDHVVDRLARPGVVVSGPDIEGSEVVMEPGLIVPSNVKGSSALALGLEEHAVLSVALPLIDIAEAEPAEAGVVGHVPDIGDVLHELHAKAGHLGAPADEVGEEKRAHVADVSIAVDGRAACVDAKEPWRRGLHVDNRASSRVVQAKRGGGHRFSFGWAGRTREVQPRAVHHRGLIVPKSP